MDIVQFIRNQRYLETIMQVLLSKRERKLFWRLSRINPIKLKEKEKFDSEKIYLKFKMNGVD